MKSVDDIFTRAGRQRIFRSFAMLLDRLPRGGETIMRIVRQRSGSPEDIVLASAALCAARGERREENSQLRKMLKEKRKRKK